jgi:hypothetical protein
MLTRYPIWICVSVLSVFTILEGNLAHAGSNWVDANPDVIRIDSSGGDISIVISAPNEFRWCVDASETKWIQPSYDCGEGAKKVRFSADQNAGESREASLILRTISYPPYEKYIRIQQGKENLKQTKKVKDSIKEH